MRSVEYKPGHYTMTDVYGTMADLLGVPGG